MDFIVVVRKDITEPFAAMYEGGDAVELET